MPPRKRLSPQAEEEVRSCATCEGYRDASKVVAYHIGNVPPEVQMEVAANAILRFTHERDNHPEFYAYMRDFDPHYGLDEPEA